MTIKLEELLFNDEPITVNRKLAKCLGLKEAVIFQQIHYWININKKKHNNFINGRYWTFNSIKKWHEEEFDFLSLKTLERTLLSLENDGLLITGMFNKMKGDKTKWYSIDYDKLIEVAEMRLSKKEALSAKRTISAKKAVKARLDKSRLEDTCNADDTIRPNWSNGAYDQIGQTIRPNWSDHTTKLVEPIPETSTKTSTETSSCSSNMHSQTDLSFNLKVYFEKNICKLGTSTEKQFKSIIEQTDRELLLAIIDYQESINTKSFAGFKKGYENFIKIKGCKTVDDLKEVILDFKKEKNSKRNKDLSMPNNNFDNDLIELFEISDEIINLDEYININHVKENIKLQLNELKYNTWINNLNILSNKKNILIISPNEFTQGIIIKDYINIIKKSLIKLEIKGKIKLVLQSNTIK